MANDGQAGENDDVKSSVEKVFGGSAADTLTGSAADNVLAGGGAGDTIAGGAGDDILNGNAGTDAMFGGDNNDTLQGGAGADSMGGGPGIDKADYSDALTGIDVTLDDVANDGTPAEGDNAWVSRIENVLGGRFNDTIQGDSDANGLIGGLGAGHAGRGAPGPDVITGGSGMDNLVGGAGPTSFTPWMAPRTPSSAARRSTPTPRTASTRSATTARTHFPERRIKRLMGFEPTTFCMASRRSSQLSYSRAVRILASRLC